MTLLERIFPTGTVHLPGPRWFEINGLAKGTEPSGCTILARGNHVPGFISPEDRREMYIVRHGDYLLAFRICTAHADAGYDEFATGNIYDCNIASSDEVLAREGRILTDLCPDFVVFDIQD